MRRKLHGILPNPGWLVAHGYNGLYCVMHKHPEAFAHITQDKRFKTLAEYVHTAEQLAEQHGKLPNCRWLQTNGYSGLYQVMQKHREAFAHVTKTKKTLAEWVRLAERLVKKHGKLPARKPYGRRGDAT